MKIVLVHQKDIKLFNGKLDYDLLVSFATKEFALDTTTLQLTFKDEEGDSITILSDEDLSVMQTVF